MGVDLSRRDVCVPEEFLNSHQIRTTLQQMGSERVPECVGRHISSQPGSSGTFLNQIPDGHAREWPSPLIEEDPSLPHPFFQAWPNFSQVPLQCPSRWCADGNQALLGSFSEHRAEALLDAAARDQLLHLRRDLDQTVVRRGSDLELLKHDHLRCLC